MGDLSDAEDTDDDEDKFAHGPPDGLTHQTFEDRYDPADYACSSRQATHNKALYKQHIQFGDNVLPIHTWSIRVRVDALRAILGSGMTLHLMRNRRLRDLIEARRMLTQQQQQKQEQRQRALVDEIVLKKAHTVYVQAAKTAAELKKQEENLERRKGRFEADINVEPVDI